MKKLLLGLSLFVSPLVAMEESSGDADDESSFDDGRSERWTVGPGADERPNMRTNWRALLSAKVVMMPESVDQRRAREQRVADADARQKRSSHHGCLSFLRRKK